jgi:hypothetical protein
MKKIISHWYELAIYIAAGVAMLIGLGNWSFEQRILLLSLCILHVHFFEEFGFPGGFVWGGLKVEQGQVDPDVAKWPLNTLSAWWGNEWFALSVYTLPLFLPHVHWLVLSAVIFAFAEVLMHVAIFNIGLHSWYNPGLVSALFGLMPISIWYLSRTLPQGQFSWLDSLLAVLWIAVNYWMAFKSPICKALTAKTDYRLSQHEVMKAKVYMQRTHTDAKALHNFGEEEHE